MTEMNVSSASGDGYPDFRRPGGGAPSQRLVVLGAVIALHLVGLFAVLQIKPVRQAMTDVTTLMVNINGKHHSSHAAPAAAAAKLGLVRIGFVTDPSMEN